MFTETRHTTVASCRRANKNDQNYVWAWSPFIVILYNIHWSCLFQGNRLGEISNTTSNHGIFIWELNVLWDCLGFRVTLGGWKEDNHVYNWYYQFSGFRTHDQTSARTEPTQPIKARLIWLTDRSILLCTHLYDHSCQTNTPI